MLCCLPAHKLSPQKQKVFVRSFIKKLIFFISGFIIFSTAAMAQQTAVSGTVTGNNNQPLPGVSVLVQGTTRGTSTDNSGRFTITAATGDILLFRSIGYKDQTVTIGTQTTLNIAMVNSTDSSLNDVVVIGYQTVRRRDLTGATSVVNTENTSKIIAASVGEQIQGTVPGVTVRNTGAPGQTPQIEIRGVASFTDASPLYVIDGMIADANSTVNTDDIATIQVLKDASAAAIYGSRAANGVIIITTKKGKAGPSKISFSAKFGTQQIPKKWDVMDAAQYLKTVQTQYANSNVQRYHRVLPIR